MKYIYYNIAYSVNMGTADEPEIEEVLTGKRIQYTEANLELAMEEAYNGEYEIKDDGKRDYPLAPKNIAAGEYVTVKGAMYQAIENIPNGEPIIVGQNAVVTTVEEQLYELTKGE